VGYAAFIVKHAFGGGRGAAYRATVRFSRHTINIGSIAPGPLMVLLPQLAGVYSDNTVSSDITCEQKLLEGLERNHYSCIILNREIRGEKYYCRRYLSEQLYLSITPFHPAATYKKISFAEVDGQNFIMYANVGFGEEIVKDKMPNAKFFKQENMEALTELSRASDLPSFSTDITQQIFADRRRDRINIPFTDEEAKAQYFVICLKRSKPRLSSLFRIVSDR
jgi:hypothetical protein